MRRGCAHAFGEQPELSEPTGGWNEHSVALTENGQDASRLSCAVCKGPIPACKFGCLFYGQKQRQVPFKGGYVDLGERRR